MSPQQSPRLSGLSCRDMLWAMQHVFGKDTVDRAFAKLPESVRVAYGEVNALDWLDYAVVDRVREAVAEEAGLSVEEMLERAIPVAVERTFSTVWRVLIRFTSDDALVTRAPTIYTRSRDAGTMRAKMIGKGHMEAVIEGWPRMPSREALVMARSVETVMRMAGRDDVRVTAHSTLDGARLDVRWTP